jgi:hypothetical protein
MPVTFATETAQKVHKVFDKVGDLTDPQNVIPGTSGKHPVSAAIGTALTGGLQNAGTKGYLAVRSHAYHIA